MAAKKKGSAKLAVSGSGALAKSVVASPASDEPGGDVDAAAVGAPDSDASVAEMSDSDASDASAREASAREPASRDDETDSATAEEAAPDRAAPAASAKRGRARVEGSDAGASNHAPAVRPATGRIPLGGDGSARTTSALEHGTAAYGARFVKRGFATTAAGDLAFALGFPHLEYIIDDHPDDARAEMIAYERRSYRLGWPRTVAIRWCRITASKGFKRTPQGATELDGAGKKALKSGAPLTTEEIALSLKAMFSDTTSYEDLRELVRLYEAFVGPDLVATSIVDALEKSSNNVWNHQDHDRAQVMHHLGFMLLRLPSAASDKLRARLAAIFDRRVKALPAKELGPRKGERGSILRALDVVLNGRTGSERSGERNEDAIEPADLVHITGDEAFVREAACRRVSPDSRLVFLGGEPVLDHLLDMFARLRGLHHVVIDSFADVASPKAIELLQRVAKGKEAAERARKVLADRGVSI
jgi:hypothetical protein